METDILQIVNLYTINTEKVKPLQCAIEITDLEDSSSVSLHYTTTIKLPLDSTNGRAEKEHEVVMRAHKGNGTLLWTDTDKVNKKLNTCDGDIKLVPLTVT